MKYERRYNIFRLQTAMTVPLSRKPPVRRRPKLGRPNPIDIHVGSRVRLQRIILGLSQETLGEKIGLTFQQVQKYERGANRIGASRLWELSKVLHVPVEFFFDEMSPDTAKMMNQIIAGDDDWKAASLVTPTSDPLERREVLELVRSFCRIGDDGVRRRLFELSKTLAGPESDAA